ncbi:UDP-GalNAc:beta-1,3-N-acetylgalactosaminyltransferase 1 [Zeugodacus cucurbitae]|nr:UDP-GalNAc:beta-1,3-N-acetylgalactosaminyltransferase 1 [Zeugodacus cucurbitae]
MPSPNAASLFAGILVGLVVGYVLWECVSAFIPHMLNRKYHITESMRMSVQPIEEEDDYRDERQLIDLYNFSYIMNQPSCTPNIQALVLVPSAPKNLYKRKLIRQTWANFVELPLHKNNIPFRVIFMLGIPDSEANQAELERENFEYDDMVQGSFVDDYRNMTYKHVMSMKWFLTYCSSSKILIKVDDDVFLNTPQLMIYLHNSMLHNQLPQTDNQAGDQDITNISKPLKLLFRQQRDLLFCNLKIDEPVHRSYRCKWHTSYKDYTNKTFPPHCPGFGVVYSADVVRRLYDAAQRAKFFWIDDVHITGFLAKQLNIKIVPAQDYTVYCLRKLHTCEQLLDEPVESNLHEHLFVILPTPDQMYNMWQLHLGRLREYIMSDVENRGSQVDSIETELW